MTVHFKVNKRQYTHRHTQTLFGHFKTVVNGFFPLHATVALHWSLQSKGWRKEEDETNFRINERKNEKKKCINLAKILRQSTAAAAAAYNTVINIL